MVAHDLSERSDGGAHRVGGLGLVLGRSVVDVCPLDPLRALRGEHIAGEALAVPLARHPVREVPFLSFVVAPALACAVEEEHERVLLALYDLERREEKVGVGSLFDLHLSGEVVVIFDELQDLTGLVRGVGAGEKERQSCHCEASHGSSIVGFRSPVRFPSPWPPLSRRAPWAA